MLSVAQHLVDSTPCRSSDSCISKLPSTTKQKHFFCFKVFGTSGRLLGDSWAALGRLWAAVGGCRRLLGGSGQVLGGSWAAANQKIECGFDLLFANDFEHRGGGRMWQDVAE